MNELSSIMSSRLTTRPILTARKPTHIPFNKDILDELQGFLDSREMEIDDRVSLGHGYSDDNTLSLIHIVKSYLYKGVENA